MRTIKEHLSKMSCIRKGPDLCASANSLCPCGSLRILSVARPHHDLMTESDELRGNCISDHTCSQHSNLHRILHLWLSPCSLNSAVQNIPFIIWFFKAFQNCSKHFWNLRPRATQLRSGLR